MLIKLIGLSRPAGTSAMDSSAHIGIANNSDQTLIKINANLTLNLTGYRSGLIWLVLAKSMAQAFTCIELHFSDWKIEVFNNILRSAT